MQLSTIAGRYIFRQASGATLLILLSLTGVVWIALALRQLNLLTTQGQDAWMFIKMTVLALPNLMGLIAPIALLVASIHALSRLSTDSELIILTASGGTVWTLLRPLLALALLVSIGVSVVNHLAMPWSLQLLRDYVIQVRTDLISQVIQPGKFSQIDGNLTFHIRERSNNGELQGILLHDARDAKQVSSFLAETGQIVKQEASAFLVMRKGHVVRRTGLTDPPAIVAFDSYPVDLGRLERKQEGFDLKPRERYFSELVRPGKDDRLARTQPGLLRAELHERFSSSLYPFAFVVIAAAFVGQARTTRQNRLNAILLAFFLAMSCRLGGLAVNNVVALRPRSVWLLYALPIAAMGIALLIAWAGMRPRRPPRAMVALTNGFAYFGGLVLSLLPRRFRPAEARG